MKWLATLLTFGGYMLIYAAVAAGGKFATEPWAGLFADAYVDNLAATSGLGKSLNTSGAAPAGSPAPIRFTGALAGSPAPRSRARPAAAATEAPSDVVRGATGSLAVNIGYFLNNHLPRL